MRICFLTGEYPPVKHGGIGAFIQTTAQALVRAGHEVVVIGFYSIPKQTIETDLGVQIIRLPALRVPGLKIVHSAIKLHRTILAEHARSPIDIIEGDESGLALISKNLPITKVIRMHGGHHFFAVTLGDQPRRMRSFLEKRSFARADAICGVSQFVIETTRKLLNLGDRVITRIPNPIDSELFSPIPNIPEEPGLIVFVGSVVEKKGIFELIRAMPSVIAAVPNARLLVIGRDIVDKKIGVSTLQQLQNVIDPSVKSHITFQGAVPHDDIPRFLARAQVAIYPSHMEAMPLAWLEGMSMGKAVVASEAGPGPEVIDHEQTGLLCDPYNPASIAAQLIRVLQNKELRESLGKAARHKAITSYSLEAILQQNIVFYQRVSNIKGQHS